MSGTNSHDRRIGADAVVRGLVQRGAIGLMTTHDLALTRIAESLGERAVNVHFEDHMENGQMIFDYKMHPGVVQKSNALELMRAVRPECLKVCLTAKGITGQSYRGSARRLEIINPKRELFTDSNGNDAATPL